MYCPYCRTSLPNGTSVCPKCGNNILDSNDNAAGHKGPGSGNLGSQATQADKKRSPNSKVIIIAVAVVVAIAIISIAAVLIVGMTKVPDPSPEATDAAKTIDAPDISEVTEGIEEKKKENPSANSDSGADTSNSSSSSESSPNSDSSTSSSSSSTSSDSSTEAPSAATTKDFDLNGATCQVPRLWIVVHHNADSGYAAPYSGHMFVNYERITDANIMSLDLVDLAIAYAYDTNNGSYQNIKVVAEPSSTTIDNGTYEAIRIETTADINGTPMHVTDQWVRTNDATYLLSAKAEIAEWEASKGDLMAILDSMHMGTLPTSGLTAA